MDKNEVLCGSATSSQAISVSAQAGCSWSAVSDSDWIVLSDGNKGIGSGVLQFSVRANTTGCFRKGTICVAGELIAVKQSAKHIVSSDISEFGDIANYVPVAAAQSLAEREAAQGGYFTRDQIHNLEIGNLVLDIDPTTGKARIGVRLQETSDLANPNWQPVNVTTGDLDIGADGTVGIKASATGNAKFFRVITPGK